MLCIQTYSRVVLALLLSVTIELAICPADPPEQVDFNQHVRGILSDRCYKCHGPDSENRQAELRLDRRSEALSARSESGIAVIAAGNPARSELVRRVTSQDPDLQMPPPDSKLKLSDEEIAILQRWVKQGARWDEHWAFQSAVTPELPNIANTAWPKNAIDYFVLARLEKSGLAPAQPASREQLIRRLSFDLTGLPPTLAEIDHFLADSSADSYQRLVERLLASPAFGERVASIWLDLARYSDTYGYQVDRERYVWPWRDWIIRALNSNLSYDQFISWQLAGDLVPNASRDQQLATTFNRLHPQKVEGGSTPEEFRVEYVADRNHTFGTALLGLTLECARCHDHKYDPISQQEYYQLFAFFNNIDESGLYSYFTSSVPTPTLTLPDDATSQRIAENAGQLQAAETELAVAAQQSAEAFKAWLAARPKQPVVAGRILEMTFEDFTSGANKQVPGKVGQAVQLSGDDGVGTGVGNFRRFQPFTVSCWMQTPDHKQRAVVYHRSRAWTDAGSRGYQLLLEDGRLSASLIHFWPGNAIRVRTREAIEIGEWLHVTISYDGSSRASGLQIYLDGKPAQLEIVQDSLYKNITGGGGDTITIGQRFRDSGFSGGLIDEFQVFDRQLSSLEVAQVHDGTSLAVALTTAVEDLAEQVREQLSEFYLATANEPYRQQLAVLRQLREQRSGLVDGLTEIMVMKERVSRRQSFVLSRGAYDAPVMPVQPGTPQMFPAFPEDAPSNRLGLARWMTSSDNPLTSRVAVNHFWQMCFGQGLVTTPEDFGSQGAPPTHPQLLDWLARELVDSGWDLKQLMRLMVSSASYRQASQLNQAAWELDPDNQLVWRSSSYQLPAEMVRDNALAVSGLLVNRNGGPPAKPYEVAVSFKPIGQDKGEGLYRRSVYTYWKQTGPAPAMMALDASKRDICRVKRERTSSPVQALVILNDPQLIEAARVLAGRLVEDHGDNVDGIIEEAFRLLTSTRPAAEQTRVLRDLYQQQREFYQQNAELTESLLASGQAPRRQLATPAAHQAAVTVLINALLSYDGCVMRH
uniref:LamG-like jellyroll fold domain-containing protein n=1 Tax=uncultured marine group II/III euryarchaeote KM3_170_G02 TaxID=1457927 RepID=A0A075GJD1_9EURY|nr:hypothetical protein [uncultured marine group II/III euryarchaeote KM3_170_G02]